MADHPILVRRQHLLPIHAPVRHALRIQHRLFRLIPLERRQCRRVGVAHGSGAQPIDTMVF